VSIRRKVLLSVVGLAMPLSLVGIGTSGPAFASTKPPPFTGDATGTVTCHPSLSINFATPLTFANTGPDKVSLTGSLKNCVTSGGSNVEGVKGKLVGSFTATGGCAGIIVGTNSIVSLTITWKGKSAGGGKATIGNTSMTLDGATSVTGPGSIVGFEMPNLTTPTGSVTGSFAGPVTESTTYSSTTSLAAAGLCLPTTKNGKTKAAKGIKKLSVKGGTITVP